MGLGYVVLASHAGEQVEDVEVEHVPGADLLLDHVEAQALRRGGGVHGVGFLAAGARRESGILGRTARRPPMRISVCTDR